MFGTTLTMPVYFNLSIQIINLISNNRNNTIIKCNIQTYFNTWENKNYNSPETSTDYHNTEKRYSLLYKDRNQ